MIEAQENTAFIERLKSKIWSNVAAIRELERFEKIAYAVPIIVAITILTIYFFQFNNKISSCNMFISKYPFFGSYCEWLFELLFDLETKISLMRI